MLGRSFVGWFNPAAATRVKSKKSIKYILPTINIEPTRPVLLVVHIKPTGDDKSVQKSIQMHWDRLHAFELNCGPIYVFTKKTPIPTLCFRAKRADDLAKEL